MDALVTPQWLEAERAAPDLRILDASYFLAEHARDAAADYSAGHIPGAAFLDLASLADRDSPLPSMLPPERDFGERLGRLGVAAADRIVVYHDSPLHSAARAWWMLRTFGAAQVAILDGGLAGWRAAGLPLAAGVEPPPETTFDTRIDAAAVRNLGQMHANLNTGAEQVVDARSPARFAGGEPEPRPGTEPGHIPGARNLPYATLFHADGTWKRGDALRAAFDLAGVDPDQPIVATCGSGITAAVISFGAHLLGRNAALYDGSWSEWGADPPTPKATGAV